MNDAIGPAPTRFACAPPDPEVVVVAAATRALRAPDKSRRVNAATPHANGAAAGLSGLPPANHDNNDTCAPDTAAVAAAITGAAATGATTPPAARTTAATDPTPADDPDDDPSRPARAATAGTDTSTAAAAFTPAGSA